MGIKMDVFFYILQRQSFFYILAHIRRRACNLVLFGQNFASKLQKLEKKIQKAIDKRFKRLWDSNVFRFEKLKVTSTKIVA